jgi:serine/threonine-protein phosphatase PGAM5
MSRRVVYLVRHGQYELALGNAGSLTELGRRQAVETGAWLKATGTTFDSIHVSSILRAQQTAELICAQLGAPFKSSDLLCEGFPTALEIEQRKTARADRKRFDAAYPVFFATPLRSSTELLICHGNIIRYFVCRALQIPVTRWIQMGTNHAGITRIVIKGSGLSGVASFNETSHFTSELVT